MKITKYVNVISGSQNYKSNIKKIINSLHEEMVKIRNDLMNNTILVWYQ